jgi:hypothetical protein
MSARTPHGAGSLIVRIGIEVWPLLDRPPLLDLWPVVSTCQNLLDLLEFTGNSHPQSQLERASSLSICFQRGQAVSRLLF